MNTSTSKPETPATQWEPEVDGYYANIGQLHFSMSRINGPVKLSWHNGDGNWIAAGQYNSPPAAADAAETIAANA